MGPTGIVNLFGCGRAVTCGSGPARSRLRRSGDAGDLGSDLESLGPGGAILGGRHLVATEQGEVVGLYQCPEPEIRGIGLGLGWCVADAEALGAGQDVQS